RDDRSPTTPATRAKGASGGGGGIRTHGPREGPAVFKTAAFDRSATPPRPRILAAADGSLTPLGTGPARPSYAEFTPHRQRRPCLLVRGCGQSGPKVDKNGPLGLDFHLRHRAAQCRPR